MLKAGKEAPYKVPYGFRRLPTGKLVADPGEGLIRKKVYDQFLVHGRKKVVARLLNDAGHRTRDGALFSDTTIGRLLRDPIATGRVDTPFEVESLISEAVWKQCQTMLKSRPAKTPAHLFSGIVRCACGSKMYVQTKSRFYTCETCRRQIGTDELEQIFFEQYRTSFLVPLEAGNGATEHVQAWPELTREEKRKVVELMTKSIEIGDGAVSIDLRFLPSPSVRSPNSQREEIGNKSGREESKPVPESPLRFNVDTRALFAGDESLSRILNETTRNFLTVLALNIVHKIHVPIRLDEPFVDGANCSARNALDTLRKQVGASVCKRLIKTERGSATRPGSVRLHHVQISGAGNREINLDPEAVHAAKSNRSGQSKRQRKPLSGENSGR
jgi:hypothetical protein